MVRKCRGLPLAIVTLGGLLRTRNSIFEWEEVQRDLNAHLNKIHSEQSYEGVNGILALSYHDLPYYLKPCFLYLGIFPEDREIPRKKLIRHWIAEGLIVQKTRKSINREEETLEEVAEQYLGELMDRYMIQVGRRNRSNNGVKTYRIHDLMRDLCLSKARDENFLELVQNHPMDTITSRRIVIHDDRLDLDRYQLKTHLRSLFYLNEDFYACTPNLRSESFLLLRVLEICIDSSQASKLKSISALIHLRYLGLFVHGDMYLPNSIGKLRNLHTLHIRCQKGECILPKGISRLTRLTHLLIPQLRLTNVDLKGSDRYVSWDTHIRYESLVKLTNLQYLKLIIQDKESARAILESPVIRSGHLRSLGLFVYRPELQKVIFQSLQSVSHCDRLYQLHLRGIIEDEAIKSCNHCLQPLPASLSILTLEFSGIERDPMPVLEKLPNLRHLRLLNNAYIGSEMVCSARGFPKLETLQLYHLYSMKEWRVEKDAMLSLRRLTLGNFPLRMIPEGFQFLTTLTQLDISDMVRDLKERACREDFYKVRHIPSIISY